jgi:hypothetical protein
MRLVPFIVFIFLIVIALLIVGVGITIGIIVLLWGLSLCRSYKTYRFYNQCLPKAKQLKPIHDIIVAYGILTIIGIIMVLVGIIIIAVCLV